MASDAGAESGEPPEPGWSIVGEGAFERENDAWTAHVSKLAKDFRAMKDVAFSKLKSHPHGGENVATARVKNPVFNRATVQLKSRETVCENLAGSFDDETGHAFIKDVPKHAVALFESEKVAVFRIQ